MIEYGQVEYRVKRVAALVTLSPEFLCDSKLEHVVEYLNNKINIIFYKKVYSRDIGVWEFKSPATVWDHFKEDYFPDWLKDWMPVEWDTKQITVEELLNRNVTTPALYMVR